MKSGAAPRPTTAWRLRGRPSNICTRDVRAKTLFATHYFELTELAEQFSGVKNYHVSVKETGGSVVFLRRVEPGAADRSYGIEVAKLAGLPNEVVVRAREVLAEHESSERRLRDI